jgi:hypothetical protein
LGKILCGELDEHGLPHPTSPIATHFTKEKIDEAMRKVSEFHSLADVFESALTSLSYSTHSLASVHLPKAVYSTKKFAMRWGKMSKYQTILMKELGDEYEQRRLECEQSGEH